MTQLRMAVSVASLQTTEYVTNSMLYIKLVFARQERTLRTALVNHAIGLVTTNVMRMALIVQKGQTQQIAPVHTPTTRSVTRTLVFARQERTLWTALVNHVNLLVMANVMRMISLVSIIVQKGQTLRTAPVRTPATTSVTKA
jgi:hypothetical protein